MDYPQSFPRKVTEIICGITISDPYRWLEDSKSPKVNKWVKQQNDLFEKTVKCNPARNNYIKELTDLNENTFFGAPSQRGNKYFWMEKKKGQNQGVLYIKNGLSGRPKALVNPNTIDKTGLTTISFWRPSLNGKYVAYGLDKSGQEDATIYIFDVNKKINLPDKISNFKPSGALWLKDSLGFFYVKHPKKGSVPDNEKLYHQRVLFHKLGTDSQNDEIIFGEGRKKEDSYSLSQTEDSRYLFITTHSDWVKNDVYVMDIKSRAIKPVIENIKAKFYPVAKNDTLYLHTNYKADNFKVLSAKIDDIPSSIDGWKTFIKEKKYPLHGISFSKDKFFALYLQNVCGKVHIYNFSGKKNGTLDIPPFSSISSFVTGRGYKQFFFGVSNFHDSYSLYRYSPRQDRVVPYRTGDLSLDKNEYIVSQEWCKSKDGTKIPMFIFKKKESKKDGNNPVLLYGYGGFSTPITPGFPLNMIPFLKRGGVYVVANVRGGAEFGEKWHREGMLDKKINSFYDFIAVAEHLIDTGVTNPNKLAIYGGSNGGLLVGTCMVMRPDLFQAVVSSVALLDMVRFPNFLMAKRWIFEYGNPEIKKDLTKILKWSPYHNIKKNVTYPAVLFTVAKKDTRVDPLHSRKMTALLQNSNKENIALLRTETKAGHGPGKSKKLVIAERADILTFLDWQLGMDQK